MQFRELTKEEFQRFSIQYPNNNFWQTTNMAKMRELRGYPNSYVGVEENGNIVAACMLSFVSMIGSYKFCRIMRGPLLDFHNLSLLSFFHDNLIPYLKKRKCVYIPS